MAVNWPAMSESNAAEPHVALLRGINVGGRNLLPMKDLVRIFEAAGAAEVRTYIQSGNVLFRARIAAARELAAEAGRQIEAECGFRVPVLLRTLPEMSAAVLGNPFLDPMVDQKALHVYFLEATPAVEAVAALDPGRSPPDRFAVRGREVYLYLPNGMAGTRLTNAWFDSRLKTFSSARNWNTTRKLLDLLEKLEEEFH